MLTFLPTSDKQGEVGLYPDSGNKNLFYLYCLLCVSLSGTTSWGDCRNPICKLFRAFFHFQAAALFVKVWLFIKADRQPGAGCKC